MPTPQKVKILLVLVLPEGGRESQQQWRQLCPNRLLVLVLVFVPVQEGGQQEEEQEEADVEASIFEQYLSACDQGTVDPET